MILTGFKHHPYIFICFFSVESKAESNQTQCYLGYKNNLLVYKVDSSVKVDSPNTLRIIVAERQNTAEIEVVVWKSVEGKCWLEIYQRNNLSFW